jgi:hypothetical protein
MQIITPKIKQARLTVRFNDEDRRAINAIREHLRPSKPWVTRADAIRHALQTAVRLIAGQRSH